MFYLKQVELDEANFILGLQAWPAARTRSRGQSAECSALLTNTWQSPKKPLFCEKLRYYLLIHMKHNKHVPCRACGLLLKSYQNNPLISGYLFVSHYKSLGFGGGAASRRHRSPTFDSDPPGWGALVYAELHE